MNPKTPANDPQVRPGQRTTQGEGLAESLPAEGPPLTPEIPTQFGRYRIIKRLGRGGMGSVYLAEDSQLGRNVALKIPRFSEENRVRAIERFKREARAAAVLNHPHLCPVHDVGEVDGTPYLTMAFVEGRPLSDYIQTDKGLPQPQAAATVRKMALALAEAHAKGIVHRDLKPANVMINQRKEPIITDFGLAQLDSQEGTRLTQMGMMLGTPSYMAPEQVAGKLDEIGPATDIYSLGVILYEMLTGRLPFEGPVTAVLGQIMAVESKSPAQHRSDLDPRLEAICMKAMAKKIEDRYASMKDMAAALEAYMRSVPAGGATAKDERQPTVKSQPKQTLVEPPPVPVPKTTMIEPPLLPFTQPMTSPPPDQSRVASPRRSLVPFFLAGGLVVAILAAAITVYFTVIRVETKIGTIVLEVEDEGAEVAIDGQQRMTVTDAQTKEAICIEVDEGRRELKVTKPGFEVYTKEFVVKKGEATPARVKLIPTPPEKNLRPEIAEKPDAKGKEPVIIKKNETGPLAVDRPPKNDLPPSKEVVVGKGQEPATALPRNRWIRLDENTPNTNSWVWEKPKRKSEQIKWENGALTLENRCIAFNSIQAKDISFRARVKFIQGNNMALVVRSKHGRGGIYAMFHPFQDKMAIAVLNKVDHKFIKPKGEFFELRVTAIGNQVTVQADGETLIEYQETELLNVGHVELTAYDAHGVFKDIEVMIDPDPAVPMPPEKKAPAVKPAWVSLFNGKDLTGWKIHPTPHQDITNVTEKKVGGKIVAFEGVVNRTKMALWRVENGVIVGTGPTSHLFSERDDYADFHFRIEAKINDQGNSGQYFRAAFGPGFPAGYEAQINATSRDPVKTGSLYPNSRTNLKDNWNKIVVNKAPHKPNEFFVQEVIAIGPRITILVNGTKTVEWEDPDRHYKRGHFALQAHHQGSVITVRKIEVMELGK
jgi:serine/threonine protein kinase